MIKANVQQQFKERRDIEIAKSRNSGNTTYSLWASGRITSEKTVTSKIRGKGKPVFEEVITQIDPPYDFLQ